MKTINIDISDLYRAKGRSGIQRVIRELVPRLMKQKGADFKVRVMNFNAQDHRYEIFGQQDVFDFLDEKIAVMKPAAIIKLDEFSGDDIFFDIDSAWNIPLKRPYLYKTLKAQGVYIMTLLHDVVPVKFPQFAHENTLRNYALFISAVYTYTDLVVCNSRTTERDFVDCKEKLGVARRIPTVVPKLGSDFVPGAKPTAAELKPLQKFIHEKYILCVGTIEPRKRQDLAIAAFEDIAKVHPDVHLVIAGKKGWHCDKTMHQLQNSHLFGTRLHWVDTPPDSVLDHLYQKCYMGLYLSNYEGFGLPVAEPLNYGKVTVASHNSSLYEAGKEFADYVYFNTQTEVVETVSRYLEDGELYQAKTKAIQTYYQPYSWETVYQTILSVLQNFQRADELRSQQIPQKLQLVFITNAPNKLARAIAKLDKHASFVKEYVVIAPRRMKQMIDSIPSKHTVTVVPDELVLGNRFAEFKQADHVLKNWLLRSSLATTPEVDEEFIMLDDDNQPLSDIAVDYYINADRTYNAYYFYDLPTWPYYNTDYDWGQQSMKSVLDTAGYELLTYSSHKPQIINKAIFKEAVDKFGPQALAGRTVDEWSAYFNHLATKYPTLVQKKLFETMNWPARPTDWEYQYDPPRFIFENYYDHLYTDEDEVFFGLSHTDDTATKVKLKNAQLAPYKRARALYRQSWDHISSAGIAHGMMKFGYGDTTIYVSGVPYLITTGRDARVRVEINFKVITTGYFSDDVFLCYRAMGAGGNRVRIAASNGASKGFAEGIASLPVASFDPGVYKMEFYLLVNGLEVETEPHTYTATLLVCADDETLPEAYSRL